MFLNCICVCCIRDENCNCLGVAFFLKFVLVV